MWTLKEEYRAAWPQFLTFSQEHIIGLLSFRGGWISEGVVGDANIFTIMFTYE
tara:strand:- start:454 stop:612 length:159 start_codon:yes stop_codon:yes gene_type:complete